MSLREAIFDLPQRGFVESAGRFLTVASDKGKRVAVLEQFDRRSHLPLGQSGRLDDLLNSPVNVETTGSLACQFCVSSSFLNHSKRFYHAAASSPTSRFRSASSLRSAVDDPILDAK